MQIFVAVSKSRGRARQGQKSAELFRAAQRASLALRIEFTIFSGILALLTVALRDIPAAAFFQS
jgi:hypothetical protein